MSTEQIEKLHNEAMSIADDADLMKHHGQLVDAIELFRKAFALEHEAAMAALASGVEDLSAGVLVKSAAFLAYDGGLIRESEQMVGLALSRNLPEEIAEEIIRARGAGAQAVIVLIQWGKPGKNADKNQQHQSQ